MEAECFYRLVYGKGLLGEFKQFDVPNIEKVNIGDLF